MLASFCNTSRVFTVARISFCHFCFAYSSSSILWMFGSSYSEIQICIVSFSNFPQSTFMLEIPFIVVFRSVSIFSHNFSGMTSCSLIFTSKIFTSYSNFIFVSLFFESFIARPSFATFFVGVSSSRTFVSITSLQVFVMASSSYCYC